MQIEAWSKEKREKESGHRGVTEWRVHSPQGKKVQESFTGRTCQSRVLKKWAFVRRVGLMGGDFGSGRTARILGNQDHARGLAVTWDALRCSQEEQVSSRKEPLPDSEWLLYSEARGFSFLMQVFGSH